MTLLRAAWGIAMCRKVVSARILIAAVVSIPLSKYSHAQEPTRTTATYGAWVVQCDVIEKKRVCEMVQTLAGQDRRIVARVAVARLPNSAAVQAVLQVPAGVDLTVPASIAFDEKNIQQGKYVVCTPSFCRSEIALSDDVTKSLQQIKKATISFRLQGKTIIVPIKLDGMQVAFNAATKPS